MSTERVRVNPQASTPEHSSRAVTENRHFYDEGCSIGGICYPIGAIPLSERDWTVHFGPEHERLLEAKTKYDPDAVLTPGPGITR